MPRGLDWLLPERRDVLGMLRQQAALTIEGMEALRAWAAESDQTAADRLREIEHQADSVKRSLRLALRDAFITPIGQEDIYVLSDRLDAVLSAAKNAVRESDVMGMAPDKPVELMCALLADGVKHIATAFGHLGERFDGGGDQCRGRGLQGLSGRGKSVPDRHVRPAGRGGPARGDGPSRDLPALRTDRRNARRGGGTGLVRLGQGGVTGRAALLPRGRSDVRRGRGAGSSALAAPATMARPLDRLQARLRLGP